MTDIVERLRDHDRHVRGRLIEGLPDLCIDDMVDAADGIERLRETVQGVVVAYDQSFPMRNADYHSQGCKCLRCAVDEARAALGEGKNA